MDAAQPAEALLTPKDHLASTVEMTEEREICRLMSLIPFCGQIRCCLLSVPTLSMEISSTTTTRAPSAAWVIPCASMQSVTSPSHPIARIPTLQHPNH